MVSDMVAAGPIGGPAAWWHWQQGAQRPRVSLASVDVYTLRLIPRGRKVSARTGRAGHALRTAGVQRGRLLGRSTTCNLLVLQRECLAIRKDVFVLLYTSWVVLCLVWTAICWFCRAWKIDRHLQAVDEARPAAGKVGIMRYAKTHGYSDLTRKNTAKGQGPFQMALLCEELGDDEQGILDPEGRGREDGS
jgi:hypothetical protein